jgi:hypothetical protein
VGATVNAREPAVGPIAEIVVATHRVVDDVAACARILGWEAGDEEAVSEVSARRWGAPLVAGARTIAVRPTAGAPGAGVRFVAIEAPKVVPAPMRSYGWAAMEVIVADVDFVAERVDAAGVAVLGRPAAVGEARRSDWPEATRGGLRPDLRAMQIVLPGGSPVYLTEVNRPPNGFRLPHLDRGAGGVFIVVVGSPDLATTRDFLESRFALSRVTDHFLAVGVLNRAYRLPASSTHRVSSVQLAGEAAIEIDQFPAVAMARRRPAGGLEHGIAVVELNIATPGPVAGGVEAPFGLRLAIVEGH